MHSLQVTVNWLTDVDPPHVAVLDVTLHVPAARPTFVRVLLGAAHAPGSPDAVTRIKTPAAGAITPAMADVAHGHESAFFHVCTDKRLSDVCVRMLFSARSCERTAARTPRVPRATKVIDAPSSVGLLIGAWPTFGGCASLKESILLRYGTSASDARTLSADTPLLTNEKVKTQKIVARRIVPRIAPPMYCANNEPRVKSLDSATASIPVDRGGHFAAAAVGGPFAKEASAMLVAPGQTLPTEQGVHEVKVDPAVPVAQPRHDVSGFKGGSTSGAVQTSGMHVVEPTADGVRPSPHVKMPRRQVDLVASG